MDRPAKENTSWAEALRTLGDALLGSVQDRLELLSLELQEEKIRLFQTMIWIAIAVFAGALALTFLSLTVVYLCWEHARLAALGAFTVLYGGALAYAISRIRRLLTSHPRPFTATLEELADDRSCLHPKN